MLLVGRSYAENNASTLPVLSGDVVTLNTPEGIRVGLWGTKVTYPAPTVFVFSATIEESLGDAYFRQSGNQLADQGYLCVSLDLPGHGTDHRVDEPENLDAWRYRSDQGEDFVAPFVSQARQVLDYLIEAGYSDPTRIVAIGTSRGGFMALQVAAVDARIRATAAYAPVTNLMALRHFDGAPNEEFVAGLSLYGRAEGLAGRSLWLIIGPKGHTTPAGAPEKAAAWIAERLGRPIETE